MNKVLLLCGLLIISVVAAGWYLMHPVGAASELRQKAKLAARSLGLQPPPARGQPKPYHGELRSIAEVNIRNAVLDTVYQGLDYPWAMEFISDRELLITQFGGQLLRLNLDTGELSRIAGLPDMMTGKGQLGLMDVALHPQFSANGMIYLSHAVRSPDNQERYATAVSRAVLRGNQLLQLERIFVATPYRSGPSNLGGALEFDADGLLYLGSGDRSLDLGAQDGGQLLGKIIRLTDSGAIPADNPFVGVSHIHDAVYALGVRNPQGLVFDRENRILYQSEHGPMGGDEINRIEAGANYGWPIITYGQNYTALQKGVATRRAGLEQPLFYYLPSIATSPIAIYRGDMFPEWEGQLLVGPLNSPGISKLDLLDQRVISEQRILRELAGRVRDIKVAPDGSLYFLLQNGGQLMRLYRDWEDDSLEQLANRSGKQVFDFSCASCHRIGSNGAPALQDRDAWALRLQKGRESLFHSTLVGVGAMPPKGLCDNCSDQELKSAVRYILKVSGALSASPAADRSD